MKADPVNEISSTFQQSFCFNEVIPPHGISFEEWIQSTAYLDSYPSQFSYSYGGSREIMPFEHYGLFLSFCNSKKELASLRKCLFPLFCNYVIFHKKADNIEGLNKFVNFYRNSIPEEQNSDINQFLDDEDTYQRIACLFDTQRYIVECNNETSLALNLFLNQTSNSQLRYFFINTIILQAEESQMIGHDLKFNVPSKYSSLSILHGSIPNVSFCALSDQSSSIFLAQKNNNVIHVDTSQRHSKKIYSHPCSITSLSASSTNSVLLTTDIGGTMNLWSKGTLIELRQSHYPIWCSTFAPQGGVFAIGSGDHVARAYETNHQKPIRFFVGHMSDVSSISFHPNCSLVGTSSTDSSIRIWDVRESDTVRLFVAQSEHIKGPFYSHDGKYFAFFDTAIKVCDIGTGSIVSTISIPQTTVFSVSFSIDSSFLFVTTNSDILMIEWNSQKNSIQKICSLTGSAIYSVINKSNQIKVVTSDEN